MYSQFGRCVCCFYFILSNCLSTSSIYEFNLNILWYMMWFHILEQGSNHNSNHINHNVVFDVVSLKLIAFLLYRLCVQFYKIFCSQKNDKTPVLTSSMPPYLFPLRDYFRGRNSKQIKVAWDKIWTVEFFCKNSVMFQFLMVKCIRLVYFCVSRRFLPPLFFLWLPSEIKS